MFNGIIEEVGKVVVVKAFKKTHKSSDSSDRSHRDAGMEFILQATWGDTLAIGDSVAVNGVCTTVIEREGNNQFKVFASEQTLEITNLSQLQVGSRVNLERSLVYGGRISGHLIYGHVDKTLPLISRESYDNSWLFTFALDPDDLTQVIPKGSIAINGISLTIYALTKESLKVMIIPHTFHHTNLSGLNIGDRVNCEFDSLGKFIKQQVEAILL